MSKDNSHFENNSSLLIYQTEDGLTKIQTRLENETVWLNQEQMSVLFQRDRSVITKHIGNIFKEGELEEKSNVQNLHIGSSDKPVKFYDLDVIISVGYRVKSHRGTQFRIWATQRLRYVEISEKNSPSNPTSPTIMHTIIILVSARSNFIYPFFIG
jgi:hypothetical protein